MGAPPSGASAPREGAVNRDAKVTVAVRVRPANARERAHSGTNSVHVLDNKYTIVQDRVNVADDILRQHRRQEKKFAFDYAFDETESQESVYIHTTRFLIDGVLEGFNATVFAYGATGTQQPCAPDHPAFGMPCRRRAPVASQGRARPTR